MDKSTISDLRKLVEEKIQIEVNGKQFSPVQMHRIIDRSEITPIKIKTLTGLIDYVLINVDNINFDECVVVIESYSKVSLVNKIIDESVPRKYFIQAVAESYKNSFSYERFYLAEEFIIKLKSLFEENEDQKKLINFVSRLSLDNSIELEDDGVTQRATVKKGISGALKEIEVAPSIVNLIPYRTFSDCVQPESSFLFRMRSNGEYPSCSLFEADGGAWQNKAMQNIKEFLHGKLSYRSSEEDKHITIIA